MTPPYGMLTSFDDPGDWGIGPRKPKEKPMGYWKVCYECGKGFRSTEACECPECLGTLCKDCSKCGEDKP